MHTVPLWRGSIHRPDDIRAAHVAARTIIEAAGSPPAWVCMERGRCGGLHLHIVTTCLDLGAVPGVRVSAVWDVRGLAAYLSKPADARLCRRTPDDLRNWTRDELRAQLEAAQRAASRARVMRGGRRSPARSWTFRVGVVWVESFEVQCVQCVPLLALRLALAARWLALAACVGPLAGPGRPGSPGRGARRALRAVRPSWPVRRAWGRWSACVGSWTRPRLA